MRGCLSRLGSGCTEKSARHSFPAARSSGAAACCYQHGHTMVCAKVCSCTVCFCTAMPLRQLSAMSRNSKAHHVNIHRQGACSACVASLRIFTALKCLHTGSSRMKQHLPLAAEPAPPPAPAARVSQGNHATPTPNQRRATMAQAPPIRPHLQRPTPAQHQLLWGARHRLLRQVCLCESTRTCCEPCKGGRSHRGGMVG